MDMENEQFERVEDLIHNDQFCEWVFDQKNKEFWANWQNQNPEKQEIVEEAIAFLKQLTFERKIASTNEVDSALANVWKKIDSTEETIEKPIRRLSFSKLRIAASVLFLLMTGWLATQYFANPYLEYATNFGETEMITLPDHSKVVLQANSTLKVPKKWTDKKVRNVWLKGEAFFSVTKIKSDQPVKFEVNTDDFTVEVLGTQFDVLSRESNKRVVLQEGKVRMKWDDQPGMDLVPNEMVTLSKISNDYQKIAVNSTVYTAWAEQKLILNNTPLSEIARMLAENYGFQVTFSPTVNQQQTRTSLGAIDIQNVDDLIAVVAASYEVAIEQKGQLIEIK